VNDVTTQMDRVVANTDPSINARIQRRAEERVGWLAKHPELIGERLSELDREWDIERWLETMSAGLSLAGLAMALRGKRRGLLLPLAVQGFFLQHAIQGWCPPLPLLRKMGVRTQREIDEERYALLDILKDAGDRPERTPVHDKPRTARSGASAS
jgi:hypothetical protein